MYQERLGYPAVYFSLHNYVVVGRQGGVKEKNYENNGISDSMPVCMHTYSSDNIVPHINFEDGTVSCKMTLVSTLHLCYFPRTDVNPEKRLKTVIFMFPSS